MSAGRLKGSDPRARLKGTEEGAGRNAPTQWKSYSGQPPPSPSRSTQNRLADQTVIDFRVDLNVFRGPMDLLLYLVRKHEVEIVDIPIAVITDQYLEYLAVIEQLDVNAVGDFLGMASLLIEIKSQQVLPRCDEVDGELDDPRQELVRRLLEYKKYRDAASMLEERGRSWQQRYSRLSTDLPRHERDMADEPIQEVELWDLVSAFGRIMRETDACAAGEHRLRRHAHPRLHEPHPRAADRSRPALVPRSVRAGHAQVDAGRRSSWPFWNWCAITRFASSRTHCSAKSGSCPIWNSASRGSVRRG